MTKFRRHSERSEESLLVSLSKEGGIPHFVRNDDQEQLFRRLASPCTCPRMESARASQGLAARCDFLAGNARLAANRIGLVRQFPSETRTGAAEMSKRSGRPVDGPAKIERFDDPARGQLECGADQVRNLLVGNQACAERIGH